MKIAHYLWSTGIGGIESLVFDLVTYQQGDKSLDITVLFGKGQGSFLDQFKSKKVQFSVAGLKGGADLSLKRLRRLVNFFKRFDILHMHSFHPLISLAAVLSRIKIVYTEHGTFGVGRKLNAADQIKKYLKSFFLNRWVYFITFNSNYTQKKARKLYGLTSTPQAIVYNGTVISRKKTHHRFEGIESSVLTRCRGKYVVGTTSRFVARKRLDRLIEAFATFQKQKETILLLIGDGPIRNDLEDLVTKRNLGDKVVFTGYKKNVSNFQKLMDICVFPAEWEPFGLVAIETLALGKPTIVFEDSGGLVEIIKPLEPNDVVSNVAWLIKRINSYYSNRKSIHVGVKARKSYIIRFSIKVMAGKFSEIYKQIT